MTVTFGHIKVPAPPRSCLLVVRRGVCGSVRPRRRWVFAAACAGAAVLRPPSYWFSHRAPPPLYAASTASTAAATAAARWPTYPPTRPSRLTYLTRYANNRPEINWSAPLPARMDTVLSVLSHLIEMTSLGFLQRLGLRQINWYILGGIGLWFDFYSSISVISVTEYKCPTP